MKLMLLIAKLILQIVAAVCFILAAFGVSPQINIIALGLALWCIAGNM